MPASILKDASIKTGLCSGREVGYLKVMLSKFIDLFNVKLLYGLAQFFTFGTLSMTSNIKDPRVLAATIACTFGNAEIKQTKPVMRAITV